MHLSRQLSEHGHPVLQTIRSWHKDFPALQVCQCAVSWGDYSNTWYSYVCTCSWVPSFTQLWIIHRSWCQGLEQNYFDIMNYQQVKRYSWFPRKWNHNSINYWSSRIHSVWHNQCFLEKRKGLHITSNVEKSWIHDDIRRIGQQLGNRRNLVAVKDRSICTMYGCTSCNSVIELGCASILQF